MLSLQISRLIFASSVSETQISMWYISHFLNSKNQYTNNSGWGLCKLHILHYMCIEKVFNIFQLFSMHFAYKKKNDEVSCTTRWYTLLYLHIFLGSRNRCENSYIRSTCRFFSPLNIIIDKSCSKILIFSWQNSILGHL